MFQIEQALQERYQLQKQLGRTAAGHQSWLAIDRETNEQVVVKLLAFSPTMQWEELKLFEREAKILQALNHPRIPKYRDYFDLDKNIGGGIPWFALVQDYIPGNSLQELLEESKRFSEQQVRSIAIEVLELLVYLHQLSPPVLHRDIKPSNLILGEDKHIYLIDFGAVQGQAKVTGVTFTVVGTSGYAPLEQFWGRAVPASDLYALGATLIHLLTGISPADLPQKDSQIQFSDRINIKSDLISWIAKITNLAVEKRFSSAAEALSILKSGRNIDIAHAKISPLKKLAKPAETRIKLSKTNDRLEIHIPGQALRKLLKGFVNIIYGGSIIGVSMLFFCGLFLGATGLIAFLILAVAAMGIFPILTLCGIPTVLSSLLRHKTHIYFDRDRFRLEREILGFIYSKTTCYNEDILGVFLQNHRDVYQVTIRSLSGVYYLGNSLNETEAIWLAQEIQDWLHLR